ncbi:hypothetical protein [Pyxidicoccus xibeiensis]|uniref:hypothetical protein n=1 Tax=Pyxidicoccus xibeiensis TaxID=2906759 RepID=UPI0020A7C004|nr:hypothetical protein [Pyxidicoccus xibeiensis]MCP3140608.1 hypothetical protein [Pyxidicoccus xibeiensis]
MRKRQFSSGVHRRCSKCSVLISRRPRYRSATMSSGTKYTVRVEKVMARLGRTKS